MKQATTVRLFLLGLPLGLIVITAASLLWHSRQSSEKATPRIFTTLSEEITGPDLMTFADNLSEVIGPRHLSDPAALERAANYIESTLGKRNIGFEVANQAFDAGGQSARNLWVEIPGGKRRNECVVVTAHYDAPRGERGRNDNASGVAALLALAENFILESPVRTIRLAFLTNGTEPHVGTLDAGATHFARLLKRQGDQVHAVFCLDSIGAFPADHAPLPPAIAPYLPHRGPFLSLLGSEGSAPLLREISKSLSQMLPITVHQGFLTDDAAEIFETHGVAPFQETGFPTLLIAGNGLFLPGDLPVDAESLTQVTRSLATVIRVLANP